MSSRNIFPPRSVRGIAFFKYLKRISREGEDFPLVRDTETSTLGYSGYDLGNDNPMITLSMRACLKTDETEREARTHKRRRHDTRCVLQLLSKSVTNRLFRTLLGKVECSCIAAPDPLASSPRNGFIRNSKSDIGVYQAPTLIIVRHSAHTHIYETQWRSVCVLVCFRWTKKSCSILQMIV